MLRTFAIPLAGLAVLVLAACTPAAPAPATSEGLTENLWILTEMGGNPPVQGTAISAQFDGEGRVGGSSGCNNYSTTYEVSGNNLTFGENIAGTLMACPEPIMAQEQEFFKVMANTATFEIQDETLTYFDEAGTELAVFEAQSQELAGSSWEVISYNNGKEAVVSVIIGSEITARFGEEGQLNGIAGCNNYFASYEINGEQISIGTVGSTEIFCAEPEGVMEQETLYLQAIQMADTYKIEGNNMEMRTSDGALVASFARASGS
ncbi:MAG: META domain-containing protein [Anaerolineales bacterium]|nr:META domain-containing protein [Anaerolineales bacterium]